MKREFTVDVAQLIHLLGTRLYKSETAALRELVQNAHDACQRRPTSDKRTSQIALRVEGGDLIIHDNGPGMTREELITYFSTIGESLTGKIKRGDYPDLQVTAEQRDLLVGEFGIGLLAGFLIADRIVVRTRSVRPGSSGLAWDSDGRNRYTIDESYLEEPGTEIRATIKREHGKLLQIDTLRQTVKKYADFLDINVCLSNEVINTRRFPWEAGDPETIQAFLRCAGHTQKSLGVITLKNKQDPKLHGILFFPSEKSEPYATEFGKVDIYSSRMFVCQHDKLLPKWARFLSGAIECPILNLTLSREDVVLDDTFNAVQNFLVERMFQYLDHLRKTERGYTELYEILSAHQTTILAAACEEDHVFERVKDLITFEQTMAGVGTLSDYVRQSKTRDTLYACYHAYNWVSGEKTFRPIDNLLLRIFEARAASVVLTSDDYRRRSFLEKYARFEKLKLKNTIEGVLDFFEIPTEAHWGQSEYEFSRLLDKSVESVPLLPRAYPPYGWTVSCI